MRIFDIISLPIIIAMLIAMVNVFTEVTKKLFNIKKPQLVVTAWSCLLSIGMAIIAVVIQGWTLWWMLTLACVAGLLIGIFVAYTAMFGYDELYQDVVSIFQKLIDYLSSGKGGGGNAESD